MIVEGPVDVAVLTEWAKRIGVDFGASGVTLIGAKGWTKAHVLSELVALAHPSASIIVVLDGGDEISPEVDKIRRGSAGRVAAAQLTRREIEGYFSADAIGAWLLAEGCQRVDLDDFEAAATAGKAVEYLQALTKGTSRGTRRYSKFGDGVSIARLTTEAHVHPEIKALLYALADADVALGAH